MRIPLSSGAQSQTIDERDLLDEGLVDQKNQIRVLGRRNSNAKVSCPENLVKRSVIFTPEAKTRGTQLSLVF